MQWYLGQSILIRRKSRFGQPYSFLSPQRMKEARYFYVPDAYCQSELPEDEAQHAIRVLRLSEGDEMFLMDGHGVFYRATVSLISKKRCMYSIEEKLPQEKGWNGHIHLAIAPTKMMERIEWLAEKTTEIGFDELSFLNCKFSERRNLRVDRIDKIVVSATKQSRKARKPLVHDMQNFTDFIGKPRTGRKYIAHCYNEIEKGDFLNSVQLLPADEDVTLLVGPEGDFSIDEVKLALANGYESISLGNSRLRTETAGLMGVTMAQIIKRKL